MVCERGPLEWLCRAMVLYMLLHWFISLSYRRVRVDVVHQCMETRAAKRRRLAADRCPICLQEEPSARPVDCEHMFHLHCLLQWCNEENSCPVCRNFFSYILSLGGVTSVPDVVNVT
jgi:hypothetical protein